MRRLLFSLLILASAALSYGQGYSNGGVTYPDIIDDSAGVVTINSNAIFRATMSGSSATSNFFNITGTLPTTTTTTTSAVLWSFTSAGSSANGPRAIRFDMPAGYTGSGLNTMLEATNHVAGTGTIGPDSLGGNVAIFADSNGATATGTNTGIYAVGEGSSGRNIGVFGWVTGGTNPSLNLGGLFLAGNAASGTATARVGLYAGYNTTLPTFLNSALQVNNVNLAFPIAVFQDNAAALPTTGATATFTILDGAHAQSGNEVLTSATMTADAQAQVRSVIHSYTWTNAQVVALGGVLVGDITVATLPAKTQVSNAYVVITGAAAGPATVTVSCGDAIAGTPFINYIVPSDAKAAANTVYGDAAAERGTSIDVEFYNLPSYTATTLVTCHFISTVANLNTVTGSTGRVILETILLP